MLEAKQLKGELGKKPVISPRRSCAPLRRTAETRVCAGGGSYMNDMLGVHKVANPSWTKGALSVHLYAPGFDGAAVFPDEPYPGGLYP